MPGSGRTRHAVPQRIVMKSVPAGVGDHYWGSCLRIRRPQEECFDPHVLGEERIGNRAEKGRPWNDELRNSLGHLFKKRLSTKAFDHFLAVVSGELFISLSAWARSSLARRPAG